MKILVPFAIPRRAAAGLTVLGFILFACLVGPVLIAVGKASDPTHAALLPPLTSVILIELANGSTLMSRSYQIDDERILIQGPRRSREVMQEDVVKTSYHRLWLGTDRYGRDVLSQLLTGGRISLLIAVLSLTLATVVGGSIGLLSATTGGWIDAALMRLVDALMAFPVLFLMILASSVLRPGPGLLVLLLGLTSWMSLARLVRGQVLSLRNRQFVLAARSAGSSRLRIWIMHLIPNSIGPVAQDLALRTGGLIVAEATLSYLGLGVPVSTPTWGSLISQGHQAMPVGWWLATFPGLAIATVIISLALVGDGIQDVGRNRSSSTGV